MPEDVDKYIPVSRSDINLDKGTYSGDLGLSNNFYVAEPYADFVLVEYIDIQGDTITTPDGLVVPVTNKQLTWRKGRVLQVGPWVRHSKVGDLVVFPFNRGLVTSSIHYKDADGNIKVAQDAIFINDEKLFGKLGKIEGNE